jgi:uncharacterized membrane protein
VAELLLEPWLLSFLAVVVTLAGLYLLGLIATRMVGRRVIDGFDRLMTGIPLVQTVYGSTKKLVTVLKKKPGKLQRVVLINFPNREMMAVGFITKVMKDRDSGKDIAAVYVPTTPNPTSGYLEIVPVDRLVTTDWTVEEAMTFVVSGGAVGPDSLTFKEP